MKKTYEQPEAIAFSLCPGAPLALSVVSGQAKSDSTVLSNRKDTPGQPWGSTLWANEEESGD